MYLGKAQSLTIVCDDNWEFYCLRAPGIALSERIMGEWDIADTVSPLILCPETFYSYFVVARTFLLKPKLLLLRIIENHL